MSWEQFDKVVDKSLGDFDDDALPSMNDDDIALFNMDGIRAEVAHIEGSLEPMVFHHMVHENAVRSKAAMAMGSVSFDDSACEIFESVAPASDSVSVNVASVTAGKSGGVSA